MDLWIARHGPNDMSGPEYLDRERGLTPRGVKHVAAIAMQMKQDAEKPRGIFASVFKRTTETADILGRVLESRVIPTTDLCPEMPLMVFLGKLIAARHSGMMLVGHHTNIAALLAECADGVAPEVLACGEVRRYVCDGEYRMKLAYRVTPAQVGMLDMITLSQALGVR